MLSFLIMVTGTINVALAQSNVIIKGRFVDHNNQDISIVNDAKTNFNNKEVEFVFVSLDDAENKGRGSMEQLKIPGNHYWISENFNSPIANYLKINGIPRYFIINQSGRIEKI